MRPVVCCIFEADNAMTRGRAPKVVGLCPSDPGTPTPQNLTGSSIPRIVGRRNPPARLMFRRPRHVWWPNPLRAALSCAGSGGFKNRDEEIISSNSARSPKFLIGSTRPTLSYPDGLPKARVTVLQ